MYNYIKESDVAQSYLEKIGYYTCGGKIFYSKINALFHSNSTGQPVDWTFNDSVFSKLDWTKEPEQSLNELYDQRARHIRESYDYVVLSYSGGADSHNILCSFVRQNLKIDEIIVNHSLDGSKSITNLNVNDTRAENSNAEIPLQAIPRLKELENKLAGTVITLVDVTHSLIDYFDKQTSGEWIENKREGINPAGITRFNYEIFEKIARTFDSQKKIAFVLGIDKPKTLIKDGKFYMRFNDRAANVVAVTDNLLKHSNVQVEYFYWSADSAQLLIKQAHVVKKWLEASPQYIKFWDYSTTTFKSVRTVHERLLRSVVYSTWDDNWFQVDKPVLDWHCEFDNWFFRDFKDTKSFHVWNEGVQYLQKNLENYLRYEDDQLCPNGLRLFTKSYFVGDMAPVTQIIR